MDGENKMRPMNNWIRNAWCVLGGALLGITAWNLGEILNPGEPAGAKQASEDSIDDAVAGKPQPENRRNASKKARRMPEDPDSKRIYRGAGHDLIFDEKTKVKVYDVMDDIRFEYFITQRGDIVIKDHKMQMTFVHEGSTGAWTTYAGRDSVKSGLFYVGPRQVETVRKICEKAGNRTYEDPTMKLRVIDLRAGQPADYTLDDLRGKRVYDKEGRRVLVTETGMWVRNEGPGGQASYEKFGLWDLKEGVYVGIKCAGVPRKTAERISVAQGIDLLESM